MGSPVTPNEAPEEAPTPDEAPAEDEILEAEIVEEIPATEL